MRCLFKYILQKRPHESQPCSRSSRSRQNQTPIECSHHQHQELWFFFSLLKELLNSITWKPGRSHSPYLQRHPCTLWNTVFYSKKARNQLEDPWGRNRAQWFSLASLNVQHPQNEGWCRFKVTYPNLKLDSLFIFENSFDFEIDANRADKRRGKGVVRVAEQERCFSHAAIANDQQLEHVVEVLVRRGVLLAKPGILCRGHLRGIRHGSVSHLIQSLQHTQYCPCQKQMSETQEANRARSPIPLWYWYPWQ